MDTWKNPICICRVSAGKSNLSTSSESIPPRTFHKIGGEGLRGTEAGKGDWHDGSVG